MAEKNEAVLTAENEKKLEKNQKNNLFSIQNLGALAEYFGVERPSLSRVLSDLVKDEKLERIGRNKYKILDKDFFEI